MLFTEESLIDKAIVSMWKAAIEELTGKVV